MKKVFLILGRTASGKSTITRLAAKRLNMKILKSYCTRLPRTDETEESADHIFIQPSDVDKYRDDMIAYFRRDDAELFATKQQLMNSDLYIINPDGAEHLKSLGIPDIEYIEIYIRVPISRQSERALLRGDTIAEYNKRYAEEDHQFKEYEKAQKFDYHVLNSTTINEAVEKLCNIIKKEMEINHEKRTDY